MAFTLPPLPYAYNALEPHYDKETVEIHYSKHHKTYTDKLNAALEAAGVSNKTIEEILTNLEAIPADKRTPVINHGGGYYNHTFFWESMAPAAQAGKPGTDLTAALTTTFGGVDAFKEAFTTKALNHFGSGWAWLVINKKGALEITDTHDQVCPLSLGQTPLLTVDVWEHAYYLKFRNVRPDWVKAWWNVVNWNQVNKRFELALSKHRVTK